VYAALRATSVTLQKLLESSLKTDVLLQSFFSGGGMVVSLNSPQEMGDQAQGVSIWLYRVVRDAQTLNAPPVRINATQVKRQPLPVCLHYLITPIVDPGAANGAETEQLILGKVMQVLHDHPLLTSTSLQKEFEGSQVELRVRMEPLTLDELSRVYHALNRSFQLTVSYEVSVVVIESALEPERISPVEVIVPEYAVMVGAEGL
jgi:Pvc16 N-terminal domain